MIRDHSGITYNPDLLKVDYPGDATVYTNAARISFFNEKGELTHCKAATDDEMKYLKECHPHVFQPDWDKK